MSNTYNALIHAKQDGTGEEVANNKTGGDGSLYAPVTSIATPENGDTASKAYAVGEMFIRGGKLCTCIVAISAGDSLVKDTNYKEGDVGSVLTELNSNKADVGTGQIAGIVVFGKEKFSNTYNTGFFVQLNGKTPTLTLCRLYTANGLIDVTAATSLYVEDYCVSLLCSDDRSSGQAAYVTFTVS